MKVSLLTGGMDSHYALGLLSGLTSKHILVDVIGNDEMDHTDVVEYKRVVFHKLRGD